MKAVDAGKSGAACCETQTPCSRLVSSLAEVPVKRPRDRPPFSAFHLPVSTPFVATSLIPTIVTVHCRQYPIMTSEKMSSRILAEISRSDLADFSTADGKITNLRHVTSYNWLERPAPTIAVPGKAALV